MSKVPDELDRLSSDFSHHWDRIVEIRTQVYHLQVYHRREARRCETVLHDMDRAVAPEGRESPRLEVIDGVRSQRKLFHGPKA